MLHVKTGHGPAGKDCHVTLRSTVSIAGPCELAVLSLPRALAHGNR